MKRTILIIILTIFARSFIYGQDYYTEILNIKDCAKTVHIQNYEHPFKVNMDHQNDTSSFGVNFCEFDDLCRIKRYSMNFGGFISIYENYYDSNARLIKTLADKQVEIVYQYDEQNNLVRRTLVDSGNISSYILFDYDNNKVLNNESHYTGNRLFLNYSISYNSKAHTRKKISTSDNDTTIEVVQYNHRNLITTKTIQNSTSVLTEIFRYNLRGDVVSHIIQKKVKNEAPEQEFYKFKYVYDEHHNWILRDAYLNSHFSYSTIRIITY